jgi:hypothetical protein
MTSDRPIGGELEASLDMLGGEAAAGAWPTLGQPCALRCDTGRSALGLALRDWAARQPGVAPRVWIPSYVCPSVTDAVEALGLPVARYASRPGEWSAPAASAGDVVVVVHYFGLLDPVALDWLMRPDGREFAVIEDCVQAPYTEQAGASGDYAITSLRKWWPAPDGALVCSRQPLSAPALLAPDEGYIGRRTFAKLARGRHVDDATYLGWIEESEERLASSPPREASWLSQHLLARADSAQAALARRQNWARLAAELDRHKHVAPLYRALPEGAVPLAYPVLLDAGRRDQLRRFLATRRIYCPVHWPMPAEGTPAADWSLSQRMLSLPLDQRYGAPEMARLAAAVIEFFEKDNA